MPTQDTENSSMDQELRHVIEHIVRFVGTRDTVTGAAIGQELQKHFPRFSYRQNGHASLTQFLDRRVAELSIVGRSGADLLWSSTIAELDRPVEDLVLEDDEPLPPGGIEPTNIRFERLRFRNFKSLVNVDIDLESFTVFVGANGAGKTSALEGLFLLAQLRNKKPGTVFRDDRDARHLHYAGNDAPMSIGIEDEGNRSSATLTTTWTSPTSVRHTVDVRVSDNSVQYDFSNMTATDKPALRQWPIFQAFNGAMLLRLSAASIARPSYSDEEIPFVRHDGQGVPSVLANLAATDPETLGQIVEAVQQVVPTFEGVRTPREEIRRMEQRLTVIDGEEIRRRVENTRWGNRLELKLNGRWHSAHLVSEGTLLTLGLMTIMRSQSPAPRLLLMDDIDRALHPLAQKQLMAQLQRIQASVPTLQILCTTHSPYLLDCVPPESVRLVRTNEHGHSLCKGLIEHEEWQEWKDSMLPGEFWSYVGEDWFGSN